MLLRAGESTEHGEGGGAPRRSDLGTPLSDEVTGVPLTMSTPRRARLSQRLLSGFSTQDCKRRKGRGPKREGKKKGKTHLHQKNREDQTNTAEGRTHALRPPQVCARGEGSTGQTARPAAPRAEQATRAPGQEVRLSRAELSARPDRLATQGLMLP